MYTAKINKREIKFENQQAYQILDVHFEDVKAKDSFTRRMVFAMSATKPEINVLIKGYIEDIEEINKPENAIDPKKKLALGKVVTNKVACKVYLEKKAELKEMMELVDLGAIEKTDTKLVALQKEVKAKHKPEFAHRQR